MCVRWAVVGGSVGCMVSSVELCVWRAMVPLPSLVAAMVLGIAPEDRVEFGYPENGGCTL